MKKITYLFSFVILIMITDNILARDIFLRIDCGDFIHFDIYEIEKIQQISENEFRPVIKYEIFIGNVSYSKKALKATTLLKADDIIGAYQKTLKIFKIYAFWMTDLIRNQDEQAEMLIEDLYRIQNKKYPWKVRFKSKKSRILI